MHLLISQKYRGAIFCIFLIAVCLHAQSTNSGSIAGTILNRSTDAPIRRAIVTLSTVETQPQDAVAWTDEAGRFSFSFLPAGRYRLYAAKDGFQVTGFGSEARNRLPNILNLAAGEDRMQVNLRLPPFSTVSGVVLDDAGDPLPSAHVQLMMPGYQRRKRTLLPGNPSTTDMEGRYRIPYVTPGKYVAVAQMPEPVSKGQAEVSAGQMPEPRRYGTQYYPGASSADAAALITVEPGKSFEQVNFRLAAAAPPAAVQGSVSMPPGLSPPNMVWINFVSADFGRLSSLGTGAVPPDFGFRLDNLRQEKYVVSARASLDGKDYTASQEVDLRGQSAPTITLILEPGIDLSGKVTVEGPDAAKHPVEYVSLNAADSRILQSNRTLRAVVNKDGTYTIRNVPSGVWDINAGPIPPGAYLKSMYLGTQDVLAEEMTISVKTKSPLNIVVSTQAASLEGDVTNSAGEPVKVAVLLAPEGKFRDVTSFYRIAAADEKGHYEMKSLTPGRYRLYAMEEFNQDYIQNADLLKPLERFSVPIELKEGAAAKQNLAFTPRTGLNQ